MLPHVAAPTPLTRFHHADGPARYRQPPLWICSLLGHLRRLNPQRSGRRMRIDAMVN